MFGLILTLVATVMHAYLSWHLASLEWFRSTNRRRRFWLTSLLVWLCYSVAIQLGHGADQGILAIVEQLALDWLGLLFIASAVMLALDLLTAFGRLARPYRNALRLGALSLATVMVVIALIQGSRPPVVVRHEVAIKALPNRLDGTRLVVLADLHLGNQLGAKWLAARVAQVAELQPDMVLLLGDLFEGHGEPDPALQAVFARLKAPMGVYAVTGNHEFHGDSRAAIAMSEAAGIEWLRNRGKIVAPGLELLGIDDPGHYRRQQQEAAATPLQQLLGQPHQAVTILLSHSPLEVTQAASAGVSLMLSGHTHGGQIWPFSYVVEYVYTYLAGRYRIGEMTLVVSRGSGLWGPRMRLWHPGEIIVITLSRAKT